MANSLFRTPYKKIIYKRFCIFSFKYKQKSTYKLYIQNTQILKDSVKNKMKVKAKQNKNTNGFFENTNLVFTYFYRERKFRS